MQYSVSGDGASQTLNNGSSTATFYHPGSSKKATNLFLDFGIGVGIGSRLRADVDAMIPGVLTSRRSANILATLNWALY